MEGWRRGLEECVVGSTGGGGRGVGARHLEFANNVSAAKVPTGRKRRRTCLRISIGRGMNKMLILSLSLSLSLSLLSLSLSLSLLRSPFVRDHFFIFRTIFRSFVA